MKRRKVIKGIFLFSLGTPFIFSCTDPFQAVKSLKLDKLIFNNEHLSCIDKMSKAILPIHHISALSDHTTLPFVMKMVNDLYSPEDQKIFEEVYTNSAEYFKEILPDDWSDINTEIPNESLLLLNQKAREKISDKNSRSYKLARFYNILKKENLQYLRTSQFIQENYRYHDLVPGRYDGNFPISELPKPQVSNER